MAMFLAIVVALLFMVLYQLSEFVILFQPY